MIELVFYEFLSKIIHSLLNFSDQSNGREFEGASSPTSRLPPLVAFLCAPPGHRHHCRRWQHFLKLRLMVFYNFYPSKTGFGLPGQIVILMMVSGAKVENIF